MSFRELYDQFQDKKVPIDLAEVRQAISQLLPGRFIRVVRLELNRDKIQGFYLSPRNEDTAYYGAPPGAAVIGLSKSLNYCWARFVEIKELMHCFDDPLSSTNSAEELESLLFGLCENVTAPRARHVQSEYECFWMALALSCPEKLRVDLQRQRDAQGIADLAIAEMLKIPERVVPGLFMPSYKSNVLAVMRD